jgi:quercetin dioxygenase-like cupin family protein
MTVPESPFLGTIARQLPQLELPYETGVGYGLAAADGAAVFVYFHERTDVPPHEHDAQWGVIVQGEMALRTGDETRVVRAGDWYDIPAGVPHGGVVEAGTAIIDFFAEPGRFRVRGS